MRLTLATTLLVASSSGDSIPSGDAVEASSFSTWETEKQRTSPQHHHRRRLHRWKHLKNTHQRRKGAQQPAAARLLLKNSNQASNTDNHHQEQQRRRSSCDPDVGLLGQCPPTHDAGSSAICQRDLKSPLGGYCTNTSIPSSGGSSRTGTTESPSGVRTKKKNKPEHQFDGTMLTNHGSERQELSTSLTECDPDVGLLSFWSPTSCPPGGGTCVAHSQSSLGGFCSTATTRQLEEEPVVSPPTPVDDDMFAPDDGADDDDDGADTDEGADDDGADDDGAGDDGADDDGDEDDDDDEEDDGTDDDGADDDNAVDDDDGVNNIISPQDFAAVCASSDESGRRCDCSDVTIQGTGTVSCVSTDCEINIKDDCLVAADFNTTWCLATIDSAYLLEWAYQNQSTCLQFTESNASDTIVLDSACVSYDSRFPDECKAVSTSGDACECGVYYDETAEAEEMDYYYYFNCTASNGLTGEELYAVLPSFLECVAVASISNSTYNDNNNHTAANMTMSPTYYVNETIAECVLTCSDDPSTKIDGYNEVILPNQPNNFTATCYALAYDYYEEGLPVSQCNILRPVFMEECCTYACQFCPDNYEVIQYKAIAVPVIGGAACTDLQDNDFDQETCAAVTEQSTAIEQCCTYTCQLCPIGFRLSSDNSDNLIALPSGEFTCGRAFYEAVDGARFTTPAQCAGARPAFVGECCERIPYQCQICGSNDNEYRYSLRPNAAQIDVDVPEFGPYECDFLYELAYVQGGLIASPEECTDVRTAARSTCCRSQADTTQSPTPVPTISEAPSVVDNIFATNNPTRSPFTANPTQLPTRRPSTRSPTEAPSDPPTTAQSSGATGSHRSILPLVFAGALGGMFAAGAAGMI